jgi:hypothetical protein
VVNSLASKLVEKMRYYVLTDLRKKKERDTMILIPEEL